MQFSWLVKTQVNGITCVVVRDLHGILINLRGSATGGKLHHLQGLTWLVERTKERIREQRSRH